jgi:hypothetical protein
VRIFLSAAREARPYSLAKLIGGFEAEVTAQVVRDAEFDIDAVRPAHARDPVHDPSAAPDAVALVARPTGRHYRGLPWWEVVLRG